MCVLKFVLSGKLFSTNHTSYHKITATIVLNKAVIFYNVIKIMLLQSRTLSHANKLNMLSTTLLFRALINELLTEVYAL